jgi:uncharacterized protein with PQ loop repeat
MASMSPAGPARTPWSERPLERVINVFSLVTLLMTLPQVWVIWIGHNAGGVSLLSWLSYLVSACLWFIHGWQKKDKAIYLACVAWILVDGAVVGGILRYQ